MEREKSENASNRYPWKPKALSRRQINHPIQELGWDRSTFLETMEGRSHPKKPKR